MQPVLFQHQSLQRLYLRPELLKVLFHIVNMQNLPDFWLQLSEFLNQTCQAQAKLPLHPHSGLAAHILTSVYRLI
ncbi:hypothetical protein SDC9_59811 [bioreactor metagenome]|uniref:Uncharacterized protein n=1 Tax=bioreactor metagenome TaxID=1076179 RepID=A0A644XH51_9ZZZZ